MKQIALLGLFFLLAMGMNNLQAQTTKCTVAQMEACKKICGDKLACTAAQKKACKAICSSSQSVVNVLDLSDKSTTTKKCSAAKTSCCKKTKVASKETRTQAAEVKTVALVEEQ